MTVALEVLAAAVSVLTAVAVLAAFVWAARKDGEDQRERDRRRGLSA